MIDSKDKAGIKAEDLRIGNWVMIKDKYEQVVNIDEDGINHEVESGWYGSCSKEYIGVFEDSLHAKWFSATKNEMTIKPIPLTPDILEKCGFEDHYNGTFWRLSNELLINVDAGFWWTNYWEASDEFGFEPIVPYKKIEYLHQLQNLTYSLTNTNLIINNI